MLIDLDDLHEMMDDINEQHELADEINEIFAKPIGAEFDEVCVQ